MTDLTRLKDVVTYISDGGSKSSWIDHILCSHVVDSMIRDVDVINDSVGIVRVPCVALQCHRHTDEGAGVAAAKSDAHHFPTQRLYDVADHNRNRHAGVTA